MLTNNRLCFCRRKTICYTSCVPTGSLTYSSTTHWRNTGDASCVTTLRGRPILCRYMPQVLSDVLIDIWQWITQLILLLLHHQDKMPVIEGQLKEKKGGKWSIFKKWKSRYFTLSGAKLSYKDSVRCEYGIERFRESGCGSDMCCSLTTMTTMRSAGM